MQDGDTFMGEGGQNAPNVSDVAKQLAKQDLGAGASETVGAIIERVTTVKTVRRLPRGFFDRPSLPRLGSVAKYHDRSRREPTRAKRRALKRHLLRTTPLPTLLLLRTWRST
jgi:hypothetical protein